MSQNNKTATHVHNRFTITNGKKTVSVHNAVLDNLLKTVMSENTYGSFVAIGNASARNGYALGSKVAVLPASLGEHNFNAQFGTLFAVYYACVTEKEVSNGQSISEMGLSGLSDGSEIVNYVTFDAIEKIAGENIVIKVEMYVEQVASATQFVSGENLFVKALLGSETLVGKTFKLASGKNDHPNMPIFRSTSNISKKVNATIELSGNNILIKGNFGSTIPVEVLVLMDEIPVMRAHYISGWRTNNYTGTVSSAQSVDLIVKNLSYVTSVTSDGESVSNYTSLKYPELATADTISIMEQRVERNAKFLHEPTGTYMAVCSKKEVTVYNFYNRKANALYKCERHGEFCFLCSDGSLFMAGNGQLVGYMFQSGVATKHVFDGYAPYEVAVVKNGATYLIASRDATGVDFLVYDGQTLTLDERVEMNEKGFMKRVNLWYIALANKSPRVTRAKGLLGENARIVSALSSVLSSSSITLMDIKDCFMILHHTSMDRISVQHVEGTSKIYMTSGTAEYPMICEEILTVCEGDVIKRIDFTAGTAKSRLNLYFDGTFKPPIDIANLGDYLLFLYEDCVKTVYLTTYGTRLYFPYLASGASISYSAIVGTTPSSSSMNVSVTVRLGG